MKKPVIAIDGPAASGKSTIANALAARLNIPYINTGNLYRAVAWFALKKGIVEDDLNDAGLKPILDVMSLTYIVGDSGYQICVNGEFPGKALRNPEITALASPLSAIPSVREWLMSLQRNFADSGMIVMEGRDIGTVIFPEARYKFFLTASPEERAHRRLNQGGETVDGATVESVAIEIAERDQRDSTREVAPLKQADDAIFVDSSGLSIEQVVDFILDKIRSHFSQYRVPYADTDQMGVVYYANYLEYFERSRTEMLRDAGLPYRELEKEGFFLPVSEVNCRYFSSAHYDDLLIFKSIVSEIRGPRLVITTEVFCGEKLLVRGVVTLACVNKAGRPCRIPDILTQACPVIP
ncbi:MAG: (d)CMP kinase [Victivallaceae bacterium]|nr:(d)CMP kinase [Victivallaceae bacterium]